MLVHVNFDGGSGNMMTSSNGNIFCVAGPFVRGIYRSQVNSPHKGQWRGALMFPLICAWINGWVNNRRAGDLRRHRPLWRHYNEPQLKQVWMSNCIAHKQWVLSVIYPCTKTRLVKGTPVITELRKITRVYLQCSILWFYFIKFERFNYASCKYAIMV